MDPLIGAGRQQLTFNDYEERAVAWSPDGTRIAFSARIVEAGSREGEICVINADGTGFQQLTSNTLPDLTVSWSPDGTQIAFQRNFAGPSILKYSPWTQIPTARSRTRPS